MSVWQRGRQNEELEQELEAHVRMAVRDRVERGESPAAAEAAARREFGNVALIKEVTRETWGGGGLVRVLQDLRFGARLLRRNGSFTAISMLTLALGIGATTAIFSVVYGVLLRPLPYSKPEQIISLSEIQAQRPERASQVTDPNFIDLRTQNKTLSGLAEYRSDIETVAAPNAEPERIEVARVSRDFLEVMGVRPKLGRGFAPEDQRRGAARTALVSEAFWRHACAARTDLTNLSVRVGDQPYAVVGVLPGGFAFPGATSLWMPRELDEVGISRTAHNYLVVGRLKEGVGLPVAAVELDAIAHRLKQQYGKDIWMEGTLVTSLRDALTSPVKRGLFLLLGAVSFLLLIACANVVNLQLAQATSREGELAVRAALGAAPARLTRQFLVESLLLSISGGILGVLAAVWGVRLLVAGAPTAVPRLGDVEVNIPVLLFALLIAILVGAGLAVITAQRAAKVDPRSGLVTGGRGFGGGENAQRLGRIIIASQIALTLVLLVGAGLLGRDLLRVLAVNPGYRTEQIVTMTVALPDLQSEKENTQRVAFLDELEVRLRRIPGVREVGGTNQLPLAGGLSNGTYLILQPGAKAPAPQNLEKLFQDPSRTGQAEYCAASAGYLQALGVPLLKGRLFEDHDTRQAPHVAVVNAALERDKWPGGEALGKTLEFGNMDGDLEPLIVVGVVGDIRSRNLETPPTPTIYVDYRQRPARTSNGFTYLLHTTSATTTVAAAARQALRALDPTVPPDFASFREVFSESVATRRFTLTLVTLFAATALLLAVAGVYGVMGYSVARRTREMGLRMALGAQRRDVVGLIVGQGLATTGVGLLVGLCGSMILTRSMRSLLYSISEWDPTTFAGVALLLAAFGFIASYLPARRATRVDPQTALRAE